MATQALVSFSHALSTAGVVFSKKAGAGAPFASAAVPAGRANVTLKGLEAGAEYEVWLKTAEGSSPIVLHRTASRSTGFFEVFRISELCGDACEPDMLGDHDSGDLLSDIDFITHVATGGHFNISFNGSIVTRYCVERQLPPAGDWADYLSCNGDATTNYTCDCNNWIDRCIGRLDISSCDLGHPARGSMPECHCSAASLARSFREVGRMPVYSPFPQFPHAPGAFDYNCTRTTPAPAQSHYLGSWFSTPAAAACAPGASPVGAGCSWARRPAQHFVRGEDLYDLGFNTSGVADYGELLHNREVLRRAFEQHPARCCGC